MKSLRCILLAAAISLVACSSKVTVETYDQIKTGMSRDEVHKLLGKPDDTSAHDVGGVLSLSKETWKAGNKVLTVTYGNDKVALKSFDTPEVPSN